METEAYQSESATPKANLVVQYRVNAFIARLRASFEALPFISVEGGKITSFWNVTPNLDDSDATLEASCHQGHTMAEVFAECAALSDDDQNTMRVMAAVFHPSAIESGCNIAESFRIALAGMVANSAKDQAKS